MNVPELEAIVLAGGLGTRLSSVVSDVPKPMAPIDSVPFLTYPLTFLGRLGFKRVVLAVGYKHEVIQDHFGRQFMGMDLHYSVEAEPLGTGGGIRMALDSCQQDNLLMINGDTFFQFDYLSMLEFHLSKAARLTCGLKPMQDFDRYGTVDLGPEGQVIQFNEKQPRVEGLINGGVYWMKRDLLNEWESGSKFSFEQQVLEPMPRKGGIFGFVSEGYFIDIGIPEDYRRAQMELPELFKS